MITLDQVYLLEQKVESAVAKIQQLQAENDALRSKCTELTNALSAKSEQLTTFESDQNQIENGIKKALDRLNSIENSVLKTAGLMNNGGQVASSTPAPRPVNTQPGPSHEPAFTEQPVRTTNNTVNQTSEFERTPVSQINFDTMDEMETSEEPEVQSFAPDFSDNSYESETDNSTELPEEDDSQDGLGFDIF